MAEESAVERLLRLAQVKTFQREEHGRMQTVRAHSDSRGSAKPAMRGVVGPDGRMSYIPQDKWKEGQESWVKKGEAEWDKNRTAWKHNEGATSPESEVQQKADSAVAQVFQRPTARNRPSHQQRVASRQARTGKSVTPSPSGSLQDRVQGREQDRQTTANKVTAHPLFSQQQGQSPADQLISQAADRAVQDAALKSGSINAKELATVTSEMTTMRSQLESNVEEETTAVAKGVKSEMHDEARARLALNMLGIIAGILMVALTGGVGAIIGEVMAFGWTAGAVQALVTYHGVESGNHPKVMEALAHPAVSGAKGAVVAAKAAAPVAAKAAQGTAQTAKQAAVKLQEAAHSFVKVTSKTGAKVSKAKLPEF